MYAKLQYSHAVCVCVLCAVFRGTSDLVIPMGTMHAEASLLAFTASMLTT